MKSVSSLIAAGVLASASSIAIANPTPDLGNIPVEKRVNTTSVKTYKILSLSDMFCEVSTDGGTSWITVEKLSLWANALLLIGLGVLLVRNRKSKAPNLDPEGPLSDY